MPARPRGPVGVHLPLDFGTGTAPQFAGGGAGPTVYNQSVSGALSFSGAAPTFLMTRSLAGSLSFTGSAPLFAMQRLLAAGFTPVGVVKRAATRALTGSLSFTGAAPLTAMTRALTAASLSFAGALKRSTARKLVASITPTGLLTSTKVLFRTLVGAVLHPTATLASARALLRTLTGALSFLGGTQLWPNNALYPDDNLWPYGGHILFQLNRLLPASLTPNGSLLTHGAVSRVFTAVLQPQVIFLRTTARVFLAAAFSSAGFSAQKISSTTAKALFASLRNAGALSTLINPGHLEQGGGGWGVPMPDSYFQRYRPTLRRQKMRV